MLFDRGVHGNDRCTRCRRPLARCLNGKRIASLVFGLRRVLVGRRAQFFQLAVGRLLRNFRVAYRAANLDREQAAFPDAISMSPVAFSPQFATVVDAEQSEAAHAKDTDIQFVAATTSAKAATVDKRNVEILVFIRIPHNDVSAK